jgi:hypothetical protein
MNKICKIVSLTYGELQSWYRHGEIKINPGQIYFIEQLESGDFVESLTINLLIENSPQLSFDEEENILLIEFSSSTGSVKYSKYDSLIISFFDIERIIPLTSRAKGILESRLSYLSLSEPFFEKQVHQIWFERRLREAHLGGDALVEVFFNDAEECIKDSLRNSAAYAIMDIDYSDKKINLANYTKTWLFKAFDFSRTRPSKHGSLEYFIDFGRIFKESIEEENVLVNEYKAKLIDIKEKFKESNPRLDDLLCDKYTTEISKHLAEKLPSFFCAPIEAFILFLKFREDFRNSDQTIDPEILKMELESYLNINFSHKVVAIWLLGCYAGFQRISSIIYSANLQKLKIYKGDPLEIEKIDKHNLIEAKDIDEEKVKDQNDLSEGNLKTEKDNDATENVKNGYKAYKKNKDLVNDNIEAYKSKDDEALNTDTEIEDEKDNKQKKNLKKRVKRESTAKKKITKKNEPAIKKEL